MRRPSEHPGRCEVSRQADQGDGEHPAAQDIRRVREPAVRLHEDPDRQADEHEPVHEGRENLCPLVAEAPLRRARPAREPDRDQREAERHVVREHVHRVGEEREAPSQQPADHFDGRDRDRQGEDEGERPPVSSPYGREVTHGLRVLTLMDVRELLKREVDPAEVEAVRELWKQHSIAEDNRDIAGLLATLTDDCVYELAGTPHRWEGHEGATRFYTGLLTAFPDIDFQLTDIVVGPQGSARRRA